MEYKTSEARRRANKKYGQKAYDLLSVRVYKGERDQFKQFAAERGMSLAQYVKTAYFHEAGYTEIE
jgi:hypothetical protein